MSKQMKPAKDIQIIGRAEYVQFPAHDNTLQVPAKIDTGADSSSVWASEPSLENGDLVFTLFGPESPYYTGKVIRLPRGSYHQVMIENSFGQTESRYVAKLAVRLRGRRIRTTFTLADRAGKTYPVLLGRRLLQGKFLVDVTQGQPNIALEKANSAKRQSKLQDLES